jgi:hypothetical protein
MADGFALTELVEVGLESVRRDCEVLVEEAEQVGFIVFGGRRFILKGDDFYAVAGGEDKSFADAGLVEEGTRRVGKTSGRNGETLAHFDWRGVVVDAEEDEVHGVVNL